MYVCVYRTKRHATWKKGQRILIFFPLPVLVRGPDKRKTAKANVCSGYYRMKKNLITENYIFSPRINQPLRMRSVTYKNTICLSLLQRAKLWQKKKKKNYNRRTWPSNIIVFDKLVYLKFSNNERGKLEQNILLK